MTCKKNGKWNQLRNLLKWQILSKNAKNWIIWALFSAFLKTIKHACNFFYILNRNNRRRQLSGSSMISNFGGRELGSNNNSTSSNNSNAGSESPLPSPRFSRYIRPHQQSSGSHSRDSSSDNNSGVSHNDSSSRPTSATSSSTYSPRLGKHCSQAPSGVNLGKQINYASFHSTFVIVKVVK